MISGHELDKLIAEKVMGLSYDKIKAASLYVKEGGGLSHDIPAYSTDIASAWEVVEKTELLNKSYNLLYRSTVYNTKGPDEDGPWCIGSYDYSGISDDYEGESPAHVICIAALAEADAIVWCRARKEWIINTENDDRNTSKGSHK